MDYVLPTLSGVNFKPQNCHFEVCMWKEVKAGLCHIHQFFTLLSDSYDIERLLLNFGIIMLRALKYHVGVM